MDSMLFIIILETKGGDVNWPRFTQKQHCQNSYAFFLSAHEEFRPMFSTALFRAVEWEWLLRYWLWICNPESDLGCGFQIHWLWLSDPESLARSTH